MAAFPAPIESLIEQLVRLPGIGRRGAERLVTYLLRVPSGQVQDLADALTQMKEEVRPCTVCGAWAGGELCSICADAHRSTERVCVIEQPVDVYAFEGSGAFDGRYHVLGGTISPLDGIGPDDLAVDALLRRIEPEGVAEVIVALSPTVQGDATAIYLSQLLGERGVEVTRIGLGVPLGANLGYADPGTLRLALEGRRKMDR